MEGTQKLDARNQRSCSIEHALSKPTVRGDERSRPFAVSSTSHDSDHPSADTRMILGWMRELPKEFQDTIRELMSMALDRFGQFSLAAVNHPKDVSDLQEQEQRFRLLMDGDSDLGERLFEAPDVRSLFVALLQTLVRDLGTGSIWFSAKEIWLLIYESAINLFAPEQGQILSKETDEVVGEVPDPPLPYERRLACGFPETAPEALKTVKLQIKSSIKNLYGLLPTSRHLGKISDPPVARQKEEVESEKRRPFFPDRLKNKARNLCRRARVSILPPSGSPNTFHDAGNSCVPHTIQENPSSKQSSRFTSPMSIPSGFSSPSPVLPSSDTATSTSLLKSNSSFSKSVASTSTRASFKGMNCNSFSDEAE